MRAWVVCLVPCVACTVVVNANDVPARCVVPDDGVDPCPAGFACIDGLCVVVTARDGQVADAGCECVPGETDTQMEPCCTTGMRFRTRSCDRTTCRWGPFGDDGDCSGGTGCEPGTTMPCPNGDSCGQVVCEEDCSWGPCEPVVQCLRIRPGTAGPEGNNYQCCGAAQWQFCLPDCTWSLDCEPCSGCAC
jgi:hypothetical protein